MTLACDFEPETQAASEIDLNGVRRLQATEDLRVGSVENADTGFTRIGAVDVDRDGQIYVVESRDRQIRVYSPEGRLLRSFGRRGQGPGEFRAVPHQISVVGDTVWAHEYYRLTLFTRSGSVLGAHPYEGQPATLQPIEPLRDVLHAAPYRTYVGALIVPQWLRPDGLFISRTFPYLVSGPELPAGVGVGDTMTVPRLLFTPTGAVADTLGWERYPPPRFPHYRFLQIGTSEVTVPEAPTDLPLRLALPDGAVIVDRPQPTSGRTSSFRVLRTNLAGDTSHRATFAYPPQCYRPEQLDSIAATAAGGRLALYAGHAMMTTYASIARGPEFTESTKTQARNAIRAGMQFPEFQLPVLESRLGDDGAIWLRREDTTPGLVRWLILEPDLQPRGLLDVPQELAVRWSDDHAYWAIQRDSLDVEWLVKFQIR